MINTGGPAFPDPHPAAWRAEKGMTLRDWFAGKAMEGLLAKNGTCHPADAYEMADAMLKAREQK